MTFDSPYSLTKTSTSTSSGVGGGDDPMTPMRGYFRPDSGHSSGNSGNGSGGGSNNDDKRPEKSTATAARMIAAGLGVRPLKKTDDMVRYEKAIREKEEKRLREEREGRLKAEMAKKAAWED